MENKEDDETLNFILDVMGPEFMVTEGTWLAAAGNSQPEALSISLKRETCPDGLWPTLVEEAAEYPDVLKLLLDSVDHDFEVTEDILIAAASGGKEAHQSLRLLLKGKMCFHCVTDRVLCVAARNMWCSAQMMEMLLPVHMDPPPLTLGIVHGLSSSRNPNSDTLNTILKKFGSFAVSQEMIECAIPLRHLIQILVDRFLETDEGVLHITDRILQIIAAYCDMKTLVFLGSKIGHETLTSKEMLIAACHSETPDNFEYLLGYASSDYILAISAHPFHNRRPLRLFHKCLQGIIGRPGSLPDAAVKAVVDSDYNQEQWGALFERLEDNIEILERHMVSIVSKRWAVSHLERLVTTDSRLVIMPDAFVVALRSLDASRELFKWFLAGTGDISTHIEALLIAAASNTESIYPMQLIFRTQERPVPITEDVMITIAKNYGQGMRLLAILEDHSSHPVPVTEAVLRAAAGHFHYPHLLQALVKISLTRIPITEELVCRLIRDAKMQVHCILSLLVAHEPVFVVTRAVLCEVVKRSYSDDTIPHHMVTLLRRTPEDILHSLDSDFLLLLAQNGHIDALRFLHDYKDTPVPYELLDMAELLNAIRHTQRSIVPLLHDGVPPDIPDSSGMTPLCHTIREGNYLRVGSLLRTGKVNVNFQVCSNGHTPLTIGIQNARAECIGLLLEAGATSKKDSPGRYSAYAMAKQQKNRYLMHLLEVYQQTDVWEGSECDELQLPPFKPSWPFRPEFA
ncbi:hypothetical protein FE257_004276 [Aspergillus nanangensis]|uniref:Uncharacterized protein n=1 Tax=Aspergillus nanangensis TaxID=2582783 RepID=A0AAD4CRM3_ASPNN|nr:hypothetical protein FE257_004276 [Aspergillus nanangensis]